MQRKAGTEGRKETNTKPQTKEKGRRRVKEPAKRAEEGGGGGGWGGGGKLGKDQQKANRAWKKEELRMNIVGRAEEKRTRGGRQSEGEKE